MCLQETKVQDSEFPVDVYHPDRRVNEVDFHIDVRNAYKDATSWGFVDVFRQLLHPDRIQWGWRIDHILATAPLADWCAKADVNLGPRRAPSGSDHTVVWAEFNL